MTVLRESPWYQQIVTESEQLGEERGERRGIISSLEMTLEMKFGSDGLQLMSQILPISDLESLKAILRSVIAANTVEELQQLI